MNNKYSVILSNIIPISSVKEGLPVTKDKKVIGFVESFKQENGNLVATMRLFDDEDSIPVNSVNQSFSSENAMDLLMSKLEKDKDVANLWVDMLIGKEDNE